MQVLMKGKVGNTYYYLQDIMEKYLKAILYLNVQHTATGLWYVGLYKTPVQATMPLPIIKRILKSILWQLVQEKMLNMKVYLLKEEILHILEMFHTLI